MHMVQILPHMHALGVALPELPGRAAGWAGDPGPDKLRRARRDGYPPVSARRRAEPGRQGNGIRFACNWENPFDKVIEFGVGDNEMCIAFGYAYPPQNAASAGASEDVDCLPILPPQRP